ncbi:type IV pilus biogenesis/stability protein PilW [Alkalilimnicola sp. S0819]|uniref:type IV pilus biogenesis/stability protein PilW n=1 Tax=Alkalilimnicola sp. S0819 TaxID=2613922 RepID=UPI0012617189|nr:type IV pilus biogenesis/stability protein PilW [Alkalilimnicola sp. S0819]KAB7628401.1 type IV pilus biogenesis/stability protein PilW [Alkalilimnicola sp. S0819]MPQ15304.1 type IV pilus biogenesis/stability protein PilW [Alkalilimnicola sp. S0819]
MKPAARLWSLLVAVLLLAACSSTPTKPPDEAPTTDRGRAAEINTRLGVAYMQRGELEQAMVKLRRALYQDPDYAPAHTTVAVLYQRLGESDKARGHFQRALRLTPDDPGLRNNYGQFLCAEGDTEQALGQFQRAAADPLYERVEIPLANAGLCLLREGDKVRAAEMLRRSLEHNPRLGRALLPMAELRLEQGDALSARGYYQRYLAVSEQNAQSLWLGIRIERVLGDRDALASYALLLRSRYPDSLETKKLLESETNDR